MKLIKSINLFFKDEKSDKVYEIDLLDYGSDLFLVNFRYGRRNSVLREGTKTVFPVELSEAEKIFDKLVQSKIKKGYSESTDIDTVSVKEVNASLDNTQRDETIIKYLEQAKSGTYTRNWKVSKIIMRAGVLNLTDAARTISTFIDSNDDFEQYAAITALAKFNYGACEQLIFESFQRYTLNDKIGRAAAGYILKVSENSSPFKLELFNHIEGKISEDLKNNLKDSNNISHILSANYLNDGTVDTSLLYHLYLLSYKYSTIKQAIYTVLESLPLKANTFKAVRYIYRTAELLNDFEFLGLISKKTAISAPGYSGEYVFQGNKWVNTAEEKRKKNPSVAFSIKTKNYFNTTTYKTLHQLGLTNQAAYVDFAKNILCALNDSVDQESQEIETRYDYNYESNQYSSEQRVYPKYATHLSLMYILFGNSTRFNRAKTKWYYIADNNTADLTTREDMYPEIWNTNPQAVLFILANSKSEEAISFALRIIQDNPTFSDQIPSTLYTKLINHYDNRVVELFVAVLKKKFAQTQADNDILFALLNSKSEKAVQLALKWLTTYESKYFVNSAFITELILIDNRFIQKWLFKLYEDFCPYKLLISVNDLQPIFDIPSTYSSDYLEGLNELITETRFRVLFNDITPEFIQRLTATDSTANKIFAINFGKISELSTFDLFKDSIQDYIGSEEASIRKAGVSLLAQFPDDYLVENHSLISSYCFSQYAEVRQAIRPSLSRLLTIDHGFKNNLQNKLLHLLAEQETYEGVQENAYEILITHYGKNLSGVSKEGILTLLLSKYEFAQKLGIKLFNENIDIKSLSISELVSLSTSDIKVIREKFGYYFDANSARANYELNDLLTVFNSNWQDIRSWAFQFLESSIKVENWTFGVLLYLCDHVKPDVQAFGRKMVSMNFQKEKGLDLLLHLSEHPSKSMQFFATNYLDNYAKDSETSILALEGYFKTTLFNINTNRAAKDRIFNFLKNESLKNKAVATMTIRVINSILVTKNLTDRNQCLDILLTINEVFSDLNTPVKIN